MPGISEQCRAGRCVGRHFEGEGVDEGTSADVGVHDFPALAAVEGERGLAGAAFVPGGAVEDPGLLGAGGPGCHGCALGRGEDGEVAAAGIVAAGGA